VSQRTAAYTGKESNTFANLGLELSKILFAVPSKKVILIGERSPKNLMSADNMLFSEFIVIASTINLKRWGYIQQETNKLCVAIDHGVSCPLSDLSALAMW
jgi:hypothetical protein